MFITRLKALRLHKEICTEKLCKNCELYEKVAGFKFNQLDFTRYKSQETIPRAQETRSNSRIDNEH